MRLDAERGRLVADNEDYNIPVNELQVDTMGDLVVFRVLTEERHLYCAAIHKAEPDAAIRDVGAIVVAQAQTDGKAVQVQAAA